MRRASIGHRMTARAGPDLAGCGPRHAATRVNGWRSGFVFGFCLVGFGFASTNYVRRLVPVGGGKAPAPAWSHAGPPVLALNEDVARVTGKCLCHMSQGLWQMSRRDMTSPCPTPRQMSRHVAMFPQFCAHRGSDGVSEVEKSAPLLKSSLLSQKLPRNAVKTARITRKTWVLIPLFLPR